jgi:hypothetical protein
MKNDDSGLRGVDNRLVLNRIDTEVLILPVVRPGGKKLGERTLKNMEK